MKFSNSETEIAEFLNEYLQKNHENKQITVALADEKDVFCSTTFSGKKLVEMGVELIKMGFSEMKGVSNGITKRKN